MGKYERDDACCLLMMLKIIADAFEGSMDYLVVAGVKVSFDIKTLNVCRILRSWTMLLKISSTFLLLTYFKFNAKKLTFYKIYKYSVEGFVLT